MKDSQTSTADLVSRDNVPTKEVMPALAQTSHKHWPRLTLIAFNAL